MEAIPAPLPDETINILVVGGADIRHVIKTAAKGSCSLTGQKLRFFLHENHHEVLARHILCLQILNNTHLPIRERVEIFLSVFGNSLVRGRDAKYVAEIAAEFVEIMADNSSHPLSELVELGHLKFKDRDILADIFKNWCSDVPFDIEALRDQRCRGYYRERYDFRKNLMDADYQTHIKQVAGIINWFHYKEFCHTGISFETRLGTYDSPNRTLASYNQARDCSRGTTVEVRGFWGDIINSPYHAFGTTADKVDRVRLMKVSGGMYRHTETDVSEFNLMAYLNEMETGQPFNLPEETPDEDIFPFKSPLEAVQTCAKSEKLFDAKTPQRRRAPKKETSWPQPVRAFQGVKIVLMTGDIRELLRKPKYRGLFSRAFIGSLAAMPLLKDGDIGSSNPVERKILKPPSIEEPDAFGSRLSDSLFTPVMREGALVIVETMKYQAHFDAAIRLAFRHNIAKAGHRIGWQLADERRAVPQIEHDMSAARACGLEKNATDFIRFVTPHL